MKKLRPIILAVVITIISITGIVLVSNNVSAISGGNQGNGDCWGIDIFTDAATENKTTSKTPTTMTIATTPLQKITVGRTTVKKVTIKKKTAKIRLK